MIIREIVDHPELIETFDFFNDTKDTIQYLKRNGHDELAKKLRAADKKYCNDLFNKLNLKSA